MIGYTLPEIRRLLISLIQACAPDPERRLVLVPLAPTTPVPGPAMPLPATRLRTHLSAVAVLSVTALLMCVRCHRLETKATFTDQVADRASQLHRGQR